MFLNIPFWPKKKDIKFAISLCFLLLNTNMNSEIVQQNSLCWANKTNWSKDVMATKTFSLKFQALPRNIACNI